MVIASELIAKLKTDRRAQQALQPHAAPKLGLVVIFIVEWTRQNTRGLEFVEADREHEIGRPKERRW